MSRFGAFLLGLILILTSSHSADATIPYSMAGGPFPAFGPGLSAPPIVGGKEYSHDADSTTIGAIGSPPPFDAQQIIAWDGIGGTVDVTDYTGTRPSWTPEDEIDAIANHIDFAYNQLKSDVAHLVFTVDDSNFAYPNGLGVPPVSSKVPSAGPIAIPIGMIGGAGEISYELGTAFGAAPSTVGTWAIQADINGMPFPDDVDGIEVWGPEPPLADADKYSLDPDISSGVSVWNASGSAYISQNTITSAVTSLLGPNVNVEEINVDALMVHDVLGDPDRFDESAAGIDGDEIIFSIRQITDRVDPTGYYATGSELFVLSGGAPPTFLSHGGHVWDKANALSSFNVGTAINPDVLDINGIEAIGEESIPEPGTACMLLIGAGVLALRRRRT